MSVTLSLPPRPSSIWLLTPIKTCLHEPITLANGASLPHSIPGSLGNSQGQIAALHLGLENQRALKLFIRRQKVVLSSPFSTLRGHDPGRREAQIVLYIMYSHHS